MASCSSILLPQTACALSLAGCSLYGRCRKSSAKCLLLRGRRESRVLELRVSRLSAVGASKLDTDTSSNSSFKEEEEEKVEVYVDPKRALKEVFTTLDTGKYECKSCGYTYETKAGDSNYPVPPGTLFSELPSDWACPTCGAARATFKSTGVEVAGFAENQKYGLGANSMTSGQKSILIYGSLLLFFMFFLSGYLLQ